MLHASCSHGYNLLLPPYKVIFFSLESLAACYLKDIFKKYYFLWQVSSKLKGTGGECSEIKAMSVCFLNAHTISCGLP